jgi:3',5'-cyclic-AMP phosphodiesterase
MVKVYRIIGLVIIFFSALWACSDPFSYSPFEAVTQTSLRNITEKNLNRLRQLDTARNRPFKVALIADSHYHLNNLADAVADINRKNEYSFIIVAGDIAENGLVKEFELFHQIMNHAHVPYLTVIGNHDYLSNGATAYQQMFGPLNYTFTFHQVKFVAWDNTVWESEKQPDYEWLAKTLAVKTDEKTPSEPYDHIIPVSHIPPFDNQLAETHELYHSLLRQHQIKLSVHGHKHEYSVRELYGDEIQFLTVGSPQKRAYAELSITPDIITVSKIEY